MRWPSWLPASTSGRWSGLLLRCAIPAASLPRRQLLLPGQQQQQQVSLWLRCPASGVRGGPRSGAAPQLLYAALSEGSGELLAGPVRLTPGLGAGEGSLHLLVAGLNL